MSVDLNNLLQYQRQSNHSNLTTKPTEPSNTAKAVAEADELFANPRKKPDYVSGAEIIKRSELEYERAIQLCRAAQPLLQSLTADDRNGQSRVDITVLDWNLAYVLLAAKRMDEAAEILEPNFRQAGSLEQRLERLVVEVASRRQFTAVC